ncbi:MAG: ATP-binding protein [Thermodesulfobacteriota bacterium]
MTNNPLTRFSLSTRITINLSLLLIIVVAMGMTTVWYADRFNTLLLNVTGESMDLLQAARQMETALANQKGNATYYFLDNDPKWLVQLDAHRKEFNEWMTRAFEIEQDPDRLGLLETIHKNYERYVEGKNRVIELYRSGKREEGERLHWEVREQFATLNNLCAEYRHLNDLHIREARKKSQENVNAILTITILLVILELALGALFVVNLTRQVLAPIRALSRTASAQAKPGANEVRALAASVHGLMDDVKKTREELKQSREMLLSSEKMALVGRLASVVAHSIRNPMTSINMRLFSLQRNLSLSPSQKEDLEVVADEMRRLDNIVRNFLEFSRPHKLKKQLVDISQVIDMSVDLLSYKLDLYGIKVSHEKTPGGITVEADPGLIKEVFVNLIVNACEAMEEGGKVTITETVMVTGKMGRAVVINVADNGPGIPEEMQGRILKPFETTKADGTGLGLFVAARTIEEHGGTLEFISTVGKGTTFTITLPVYQEATA